MRFRKFTRPWRCKYRSISDNNLRYGTNAHLGEVCRLGIGRGLFGRAGQGPRRPGERRPHGSGRRSGPCRGPVGRGFALRTQDFESGAGGGRTVARGDSLPERGFNSHQSRVVEERAGAGEIVERFAGWTAIHVATAPRLALFGWRAIRRGRCGLQFPGVSRRKNRFGATGFAGGGGKNDYGRESRSIHGTVRNGAALRGRGGIVRWGGDSTAGSAGINLRRGHFFGSWAPMHGSKPVGGPRAVSAKGICA